MSIILLNGKKYWRVRIGVDKDLGEDTLKKVILTIEKSLRQEFPGEEMPRRRAVRELFSK
jgi:peptidyl-tRNA hydrolase